MPLAATEVHLGCTREEQLRWLKEIWDAALRLRARGVDVRGHRMGAARHYDWDSLLTRRRSHYETGAFDVRTQQPRPTAVARIVRDLATKGDAKHPVLDSPGWWRRKDRFVWPRSARDALRAVPPLSGRSRTASDHRPHGDARPRCGSKLRSRGLSYHALSRGELDLADPRRSRPRRVYQPWAVVNAAGFACPDAADADQEECQHASLAPAYVLARACAADGIQPARLVVSSGVRRLRRGRISKAMRLPRAALRDVQARSRAGDLASCPRALLVAALFAPWDQADLIARAIPCGSARGGISGL